MSDDDYGQKIGQDTAIINDGGKPLLSRIFAALTNQRRRYILYYLRDNDQAQTNELATQIVSWEQDIPLKDVPSEEAEQVQVNLVHSHLPKLEDYGLVEYDRRSETVCYTYPPALLDEALELTASIENPP